MGTGPAPGLASSGACRCPLTLSRAVADPVGRLRGGSETRGAAPPLSGPCEARFPWAVRTTCLPCSREGIRTIVSDGSRCERHRSRSPERRSGTSAHPSPHGSPRSRETAAASSAALASRYRWITSSRCRGVVAMSSRTFACSVRHAIGAAPARNMAGDRDDGDRSAQESARGDGLSTGAQTVKSQVGRLGVMATRPGREPRRGEGLSGSSYVRAADRDESVFGLSARWFPSTGGRRRGIAAKPGKLRISP